MPDMHSALAPQTQAPNALDRPLTATRFQDAWAKCKSEHTITLRALVGAILARKAPIKEKLPWIKLAVFGDRLSDKGSLRHDPNVLGIEGIEGDYDGEAMPMEEARDRLSAARLAALVCTSPSHTDDKPRWRVFCPTSVRLPPERRAALVARANGVLGGVLSGESFALSQAYFYGSVEGNAAHRAVLSEGRYIDAADELDAEALGKPAGKSTPRKKAGGAAKPAAAVKTETRDTTRSGDLARLTVRMKRMGASFEEYRAEAEARPLTAGIAAEQGERALRRCWDRLGNLLMSSKDKPLSNLHNALWMLREDPELSGIVAFDEMEQATMLMRPVPRFNIDEAEPPGFTPRRLTDDDETGLREYLQAAGLTTLPATEAKAAVDRCAKEGAFHPVRDYLDGLAWDGVPRMDSWMTTYLGAKDTPYTRAVGRCFLISMAARIYRPGCKVDYMPVLEGAQGERKSTACGILGGLWFSDGLPELHGDPVRVAQHLNGKWLIEIPELHAMGRAESSSLKAFITRQVERYTRKFGRREVEEPRQCVFIGSTNPEGNGYLKDSTGGRRFWPVKVGMMDTDALTRDRDELFAEAVTAYRAGEPWWPNRDFEARYIEVEQEARYEADPWEDLIREYLDGRDPASFPDAIPIPPARVTSLEIARDVLHISTERINPLTNQRISKCLTRAGWVQKRSERERWWEHATHSGAGAL
jgi:predicted P-loop ATPase